MKGYSYQMAGGRIADCAPCKFCKHKGKMIVEAPCYNCISTVDLALHKPNAETEFACFEAESDEFMNRLMVF